MLCAHAHLDIRRTMQQHNRLARQQPSYQLRRQHPDGEITQHTPTRNTESLSDAINLQLTCIRCKNSDHGTSGAFKKERGLSHRESPIFGFWEREGTPPMRGGEGTRSFGQCERDPPISRAQPLAATRTLQIFWTRKVLEMKEGKEGEVREMEGGRGKERGRSGEVGNSVVAEHGFYSGLQLISVRTTMNKVGLLQDQDTKRDKPTEMQ